MKNTHARALAAVSAMSLALSVTTGTTSAWANRLHHGTTAASPAPIATHTWSHLAGPTSKAQLQAALTTAGVEKKRIDVLLKHADQFTAAIHPVKLSGTFIPLPFTKKYDVYDLQEKWNKKHPNFHGYNCRITAYSLMGPHITVGKNPAPTPAHPDLFLDEESLKTDPSALIGGQNINAFKNIFTTIPTTHTTSTKTHVETVQAAWKKRGVTFTGNTKARLISVFQHNNIDKDDLFIGHTGVAFPQNDGRVLFVEKLAFQEPYVTTMFANRTELANYLFKQYDLNNPDLGLAKPIIMENDKLMEGAPSAA
ncbi:Uncharacterised protein [Dermatophilus congolensis]|uniref:DUF4300 domain-containing protein n=1 Tax=Dermatophilus congolensis TaxID=1863 RepID=A0AA46BP56_9MICO|nr:DUF4300 family protein [Dermatophilus congolensis]STD11789.1 Uncharacterised protein [Dermatophilus congolensis]